MTIVEETKNQKNNYIIIAIDSTNAIKVTNIEVSSGLETSYGTL